MHVGPFMAFFSASSGADLPFWGKINVMSKAGKPFLPTLPCCCFNFQAVLGSPLILYLTYLYVFKILLCIPIFTLRLRSSTSRPIAATSVETSIV